MKLFYFKVFVDFFRKYSKINSKKINRNKYFHKDHLSPVGFTNKFFQIFSEMAKLLVMLSRHFLYRIKISPFSLIKILEIWTKPAELFKDMQKRLIYCKK